MWLQFLMNFYRNKYKLGGGREYSQWNLLHKAKCPPWYHWSISLSSLFPFSPWSHWIDFRCGDTTRCMSMKKAVGWITRVISGLFLEEAAPVCLCLSLWKGVYDSWEKQAQRLFLWTDTHVLIWNGFYPKQYLHSTKCWWFVSRHCC